MRFTLSVCAFFIAIVVFTSPGFAQPLQFAPAGLSHSDGSTFGQSIAVGPAGFRRVAIYSKSDRYVELAGKLTELLKSWYIISPRGEGGYVQHGWRKGDAKLHEDHGHHEGNVDCYALFMLLGERELAQPIRSWLDSELAGRNELPLDLYTWRVAAFNGQHAELLDIPGFDLRFRKKVPFNGREVIGFFSSPNAEVNNIWTEGAAHMSCAYAAAGDLPRANFYANQLDAAIIEQHVGGKLTHSLPYALNGEGGYEWVKQDEGFVSTAAWYIFAKHRFNPLRLTEAD